MWQGWVLCSRPLNYSPVSKSTNLTTHTYAHSILISQNVMDISREPHTVRQTSEHGTAELTGSVGTGPALITTPHCPCIPSSLCATDPIPQTDTIRARKKTGLPRDYNPCTIPCSSPYLNDAPVMGQTLHPNQCPPHRNPKQISNKEPFTSPSRCRASWH